MSLVLDLPTEMEAELATEAARLGLPLSEYAVRLIAEGRAKRPAFRTGAELLEYWQREGLIGTRTDIADSQAHIYSPRLAHPEQAPDFVKQVTEVSTDAEL